MRDFVPLFRAVLFIMINMAQLCTPSVFDQFDVYMEMKINNGNAATVPEPCSVWDTYVIDNCFALVGARRSLRGVTTTSIANTTQYLPQQQVQKHHQVQDQRKAYPLLCKDACAGYAPKTCRVKKCEGYRRELYYSSINEHFDTYWCNVTIDATNRCLDAKMWKISRSCREFYDPKLRTATCRLFQLC